MRACVPNERVQRSSWRCPKTLGDAFAAQRKQAHYEKLADAVAEYVQALLLARHGLRRRLVDGVDVYASPDANTASGLLVLICGSGQVAAGQWARRLCINESLRTGAVLPYLGAQRSTLALRLRM
jgi:hypothetical protein